MSAHMSSGKDANASHVEAKRHVSRHIFGEIHSSPRGGATSFSATPTPPVRKKENSSGGSAFSLPMMRQSSRNENRSLSFSNSERHTFWYSEYVKCSLMTSRRDARSSVCFSDPWMDRTNKPMNQLSEYWYMGSMLARSRMVKKSTALYAPQGLYPSRASSISTCVSSATFCFSEISSETIFASESTSMAFASSRMFPSEEDMVCRMRSSISFRRFLLSAEVTTSSCRCDSRSGRSSATTTPRSWSDKPSGVIMKLSSVTFTAVSGR